MKISCIKLLMIAALIAILTGGCGKKPVEYGTTSESMKPEGYGLDSSAPPGDSFGGDTFSAGDLESLDSEGANPLAGDTMSEEYRAMYGRSTAPLFPVYFDFDSSAINVDQLDNLNSSGAHLLANKSMSIVVEGNCDARGTTDYNLALGELRAQNVKNYLVNLGVPQGRITTISYGSQRPLYPGNDEDSWAMNRRADLVVR